jgi:ribosome-associated translation inhibitor RaiA
MKLAIQHYHLDSSHELDLLIRTRLLGLQPRLHIDEAKVQLEYLYEESPAFSVKVHVATPGPDLRVERRDHTIRAAIDKALKDVETKAANRSERHRLRLRERLREPGLPNGGRGRR